MPINFTAFRFPSVPCARDDIARASKYFVFFVAVFILSVPRVTDAVGEVVVLYFYFATENICTVW